MKNYNKNTIYGNFNRSCNQNGYFNKVTDKNYDSILTGQVMCKKKIIEDYMRNYFHKHEKWLIDNHGNCEDLGLNFFIRNFYKEKPVYVKGKTEPAAYGLRYLSTVHRGISLTRRRRRSASACKDRCFSCRSSPASSGSPLLSGSPARARCSRPTAQRGCRRGRRRP